MTALRHYPTRHFTNNTIKEIRLDRKVIRTLYKLPLVSEYKTSEGLLANRCSEDRISAAFQGAMRRLSEHGYVELTPCRYDNSRYVQLTPEGVKWGEDMRHEDDDARREAEYYERGEKIEGGE